MTMAQSCALFLDTIQQVPVMWIQVLHVQWYHRCTFTHMPLTLCMWCCNIHICSHAHAPVSLARAKEGYMHKFEFKPQARVPWSRAIAEMRMRRDNNQGNSRSLQSGMQ